MSNCELDVMDDDNSSNDEDSDISDVSSEVSDLTNDNWEEGVVEDTPSITCVEQYTINQAIQKCRGFVNTINKSSVLSNFINNQKTKDKLQCTLLIDYKSRWSSSHRLIQSMLLHKSIIGRLYAEKYVLQLTRKQHKK